MKNVLFYHVYLRDNLDAWVHTVLEQLKSMEDSQLLDNLHQMKVVVISRDDSSRYHFKNLMESYAPSGLEIEMVDNPFKTDLDMLAGLHTDEAITENYTFRKLYQFCGDNPDHYNICYVHNKGVTRTASPTSVSVKELKKYFYWRQLLNYGVLENWEDCVNALEDHNTAGINFYNTPSPHYSGNFWWATSEYINTLPDPSTMDWWETLKSMSSDGWLQSAHHRFRDEQWLCQNPLGKFFNLYSPPNDLNPSSTVLRSKEYIL